MAEQQKGVLAQGVQNFKDIFHWKVRSTIINENGEEEVTWEKPTLPPNPFRLLTMLGAAGWGAYLVGFSAWTADAFDFHALSIQTTKLAKHFDVSKTKVTEAITLTLLLRSVGAAVFGICSDYFGRKYPLVLNMWALGALQVASIYCRTYNEFLAVRALFGLFMGGVFGAASSLAMESIPPEARGLFSGFFQQGYSFGYVLAACVNLGVGGATSTWSIMFWVGAGFSFVVGFLRLLWPESKQFIEARKATKGQGTKNFRKSFTTMLCKEWKVCIFAIIIMSWFNWFSHSSQDSYTTFMLTGKQLNNAAASRASILMKTGACVGGPIWGYMSQWIGRRRAMIIACLICCCIIPAWILPNSESGLEAGGFFLQACVQGAWGVVPIYLSEISPPAFRAVFVGLTYQLGNAISSPSTQLINYLSENNFIHAPNGKIVEAYGPVMGIATAIIAVGLAITASVGPEKKGARFERAAAATAGVEPQLPVYNKEQDFDNNSETKSVDLVQTQNAISK
ncbi:probable carboxylic acid transport protein JEN1 [Ustilago bromivora]|uniref:Probable carboxylic acid transport protein JEN1 n=1 Tax=Ustilago bromivora TaxID=307758 RepID=A0A1K0FWQ3_9BASI|nr:probable carboxylic acid transport protein JEN1 [Ustilago bromivora]SYW79267.1 probable carboxylic acid transport protein JEN1 [Ustilago bromivora]